MSKDKQQALVFGHSHAWALKNAVGTGVFKPQKPDRFACEVILCGNGDLPGPLTSTGADGHVLINAALMAALGKKKSTPATWVVSAAQGNFCNRLGLAMPYPRFDFVVPSVSDLPIESNAQLLPYAMILDIMRRETADLGRIFQYLPKAGYRQIIHINVPPPVESDDFIDEDIRKRGTLGLQPDQINLAPAATRLKLWMAQASVIDELCRRLNVYCIQAPEETRNERGFLKEKYWKDAVHGNELYSARVLQEVEMHVTAAAE